MSKVTSFQREAVFERDHYKCAACGDPSNLVVHHRANRGMGGDPTGRQNRLSNLLTVCSWCNGAFESLPTVAETARDRGHKLRSWDVPTLVPVFYSWAGEWRELDDDGHAFLVEEVQ